MADIKQIIDPKVIEELKKMNQQLVDAGANMDKLIPLMGEINKLTSEAAKSTGNNADNQKKLTAAEKEAESIKKQLEKTEAKINAIQQSQTKILTEQILKLQQ